MTHIDFVRDILGDFTSKMSPFLEEVVYSKSKMLAEKELEELQHKGLLFKITEMGLEDRESYNKTVTYGFTIKEKSGSTVEELIAAEENAMFIASALEDYVNYIFGRDVSFDNININSINENNMTEVYVDGFFTVNYKRRPTFWKGLS